MPISNEAFIDIENALSKKLRRGWRGKVETVLRDVETALRKGNFAQAHTALDNLDLSDLVDKAEAYLKTMFRASYLFGVSGVGDPKQALASDDEVMPIIEAAVRQLRSMVRATVEDSVRDIGKGLIAEAEIEQNAVKSEGKSKVTKAAVSMDTIEAFNRKMRQEGDARIAAIAGLQNSRIANWGFTVEATLRGVSTYEVNEVMDSLTCPVCREMHGRTFEVEHAKQKLERQLSVDNPQELKEMAPWPKQTKESIEELKKLSKEEIQDRGWDTPPYHPGCRGVLRYKSSSTRIEDQEVTLNEVLPNTEASVASAVKALDRQKVVDAQGKESDEGRYIILPFGVATPKVAEKVEALREKALNSDTTIQNVRLTRIHGLEKIVDKERVKTMIESGSSQPPLVVKRSGRYYVLDGIEVLVAAKLAGSETSPVRVYKP